MSRRNEPQIRFRQFGPNRKKNIVYLPMIFFFKNVFFSTLKILQMKLKHINDCTSLLILF